MQPSAPVWGILLAALLLACAAAPAAAAPYGEDASIQWQQLLGGIAADYGNAMERTSDGGFIFVGSSASSMSGTIPLSVHGADDLWVVKLNATGAVEWQRLLGGSGGEVGRSVQQTADGGYVVLGQTSSSASGDVTGTSRGNFDLWVMKLDRTGGTQWQGLLGGSGNDYGICVRQALDGGMILVGNTVSGAGGDISETGRGLDDIWVVKLRPGNVAIQWERRFGGSGIDNARAIRPTADGGYLLLGDTASSASGDVAGTNHGGSDLWLAKLDGDGQLQRQQLLGGSSTENGRSLELTPDGGAIIAATSWSSGTGTITEASHGDADYWILKVDAGGWVQWQRLLGGTDGEDAESIKPTTDGGYVVIGTSSSGASGEITATNHGAYDWWVVKLDGTGALRWEQLLGGATTTPFHGYDYGKAVAQAGDGGYVLLGSTTSSASGDIAGTSNGNYDCWIVKLRAAPCLSLASGWNFVSVPAVLAAGSDTASTVFAGVNTDGHSIYLYNATAKAWAPMAAATKVRPLDGIWVYSRTAATVRLVLDPNPFVVPPEKSLAAGWNAIGYSSVRPAYARDALSSVAAKWSTLIGLDPATQRYETAIINGGNGDYSDYREMLPGKGYWLDMREAGRLSAVGAGP